MDHFPRVFLESRFVAHTYDMLYAHGFNKSNTIPFVSVCRDELCAPLVGHIDKAWRSDPEASGVSVVTNSLAGMIFLGKTGMAAATGHVHMDRDGVERFVFYAFSHIGISLQGQVGKAVRPGMKTSSDACGALVKFHEELRRGHLDLEIDMDDVEYSLMKQRLFKQLRMNEPSPSLMKLTKLNQRQIVADLELLITDWKEDHPHRRFDYAIVSGVQLHAPDQSNYIWPGTAYVVVDGMRHTVNMELPSVQSYVPDDTEKAKEEDYAQ